MIPGKCTLAVEHTPAPSGWWKEAKDHAAISYSAITVRLARKPDHSIGQAATTTTVSVHPPTPSRYRLPDPAGFLNKLNAVEKIDDFFSDRTRGYDKIEATLRRALQNGVEAQQ